MPKPVTPLVGTDPFVANERSEVCLVKRSDNGRWALPGGCQELGETPQECAIREFKEETGLNVRVTGLLGVHSSMRYEYITYPHKENQFCHLLFSGELLGGKETPSDETTEIGWFAEHDLPPTSDGHMTRIQFGFDHMRDPNLAPHFE